MTTQVDPNNVLKVWLYRFIKLSVFVVILLSFYVIYLDAWVQKKMNGPKWETPVKIYSRPLQIYPQQFLPRSELVQELKLLSYRKVTNVVEPGQYKASHSEVEFYRREYVHSQGPVLPQKIKVSFDEHRVKQVQVFYQGQWNVEPITTVDPLLISRNSGSTEDRDIINLATIPEWMIDTLIVVEDKNFYHHHGVSVFAIARAFWANFRAGRKVQGGSTLTQQLAKNLLLNDSRKSYVRKFKEAITALILDYRFSKDDILEAYFNEIYLGQNGRKGVHGFSLASQFYFNKPLVELGKHEFALLVAIVKGPSFYNPHRYKQRALSRRDLVLQLMVSGNVIDAKEYEDSINQDMVVKKSISKGRTLFPAYMQLVERELQQLQLTEQEQAQGLLVFTGLDPVLQTSYDKSFGKSINKLEHKYKLKDINGAVVSLNLDDATISALIGDKTPNSFGFNRALDSNRNIGSLIKPAVYLTALQQPNYNLATPLSNQAVKMKSNKGKEWHPQNYDKSHSESIWLYDALVNSKNLPTVHLGMELGLSNVMKTLSKLGVTQNIPKYPSMLLGAVPMSPLNVLKIYQPVANFGQKVDVSAISVITDPEGINIWQKNTQTKQVADYETAYVLNYALNQVTREGTAKRLGMYYPKVQYAGKTGTTDDLRDSWFTGFDQNTLTTIWIGKDDNSPVELTGSQGALTAFIDLQVARKADSIRVPKPNSVELRAFDLKTGKVFPKECGEHKVMPIKTSKINEQVACPSIFDFFN